MFKLIIISIVIINIISCQKSYDGELFKYVDKIYNIDKSSIIKLKNFHDFKWDKMFYFTGWTSYKEINEKLKLNIYNCPESIVKDGDLEIIFLKDNKLIKKETYDDFTKINFFSNLKEDYFTPDNAKFKIKKIKLDDVNYIYRLIQLE